jgi:hypothetical protein
VYSSHRNYPESVQDVKLYNEQAVAGTADHRTFRNLQRTVKSMSARLQAGGGDFQHLLRLQTIEHNHGIFEKIK